MAIERLNKVSILLPIEDARWFLGQLYHLNIIHIIDTLSRLDDSSVPYFHRFPTTVEDIEKNIQKLNNILPILKVFVQKKKGFVEGIFPIPLQITSKELDQTLSSIDIESIYKECKNQHEKYINLQKRLKQLREEADKLSDFLPLSDQVTQIRNIRQAAFYFCCLSKSRWNRFLMDTSANEFLAWQIVSKTEKELKVLFAYLNDSKDAALRIFSKYDLKETPLPAISGNVKDHIDKLGMENSNIVHELSLIQRRFRELSKEWHSMEILLGYWENEKNKMVDQRRCVMSKKTFVLIGYVKIKDKPMLDKLLYNEFPQASVIYEEPSPSDKVPVCISLNRFLKPAQLLINMFGLPNYFTFDPTPFITVSFLILFGICFGDVFYGMCLIAFSAWMIRKYKKSEALSNFLKLFFYAGISTIIFGALTGGWAGDLYNQAYLGENNILLKLKEKFTILDPLSKPVIALLLSIGLGILNQFYGIVLKMYGEFRRKNIVNAVCDGLLWLIALPGFLILVSTIFLNIPAVIVSVGKYLTVIGAIGLISTQGRNAKGIAGKIFTGIISLYGIVGTYGCVSFIGDILSYTRILALSLTTSIVGMSFNIIAGVFKTGTLIGTVLFIIILISGHSFNFVMSILSAFVHPARLIFLELFGRFYEGGAQKFQPYGFSSQRITIVKIFQNKH